MIYGMGLIALGLAWVLPGHFFPWTGFQQEVLAAIGAALVALAALVSTGQHALPRPRVTLFAVLAAVPLIQWRLGVIPFFADALLPALYLMAFSLAVIAGAAVYEVHGDRFVAGLFGCFVGAAIVSTGIGLVQWLQLGNYGYMELMDSGARVYANLIQPNHLASLLGLGIAGLLWFYETRRIGAAVAGLGVAFLGVGVVMTQSRAGWGAMIVVAAWALVSRARLGLRITPLAVAVACLAFAAAVFGWQALSLLLVQGTDLSFADRVQAGTRPIHWATLFDAAMRSPWVGYGWQQVGIAQQLTTLDHPPSHEWLGYSHDLLLDLVVWNGLPLGLLVFGAIVWWLVSRARACRDVDTWALLLAVGVLCLHSMVEFPYAYTYFLLPMGLMVGVIESRYAGSTSNGVQPSMSRALFAMLLVAMVSLLGWIVSDYLDIEDAARRVAFKEAGYVSDQPPQVPDVRLLDNQREFLRFRLTPAREGMTPQQLDWMRTVTKRFAPPPAMLRYALATGLNGRAAEATLTLNLLCHMWPSRNCEEGRDAWKKAQEQWPRLKAIAFPPSPDPRTDGG